MTGTKFTYKINTKKIINKHEKPRTKLNMKKVIPESASISEQKHKFDCIMYKNLTIMQKEEPDYYLINQSVSKSNSTFMDKICPQLIDSDDVLICEINDNHYYRLKSELASLSHVKYDIPKFKPKSSDEIDKSTQKKYPDDIQLSQKCPLCGKWLQSGDNIIVRKDKLHVHMQCDN